MRNPAIAIALGSFLIASVALADALPVKPGLWESTVTTTNPMTGTQTQVNTECLKDEKWDPKSMLEDTEGCEIAESTLNGNTLSFTMTCNVQGAKGTMKGNYSTQGDSGVGNMTINMSFGGQSMVIESSYTSRRLEDC